jgi:hypothetical protein
MPPKATGLLSREIITCDYCENEMERRNLKAHTANIHSGRQPKERVKGGQKLISFAVKKSQVLDPNANISGESSAKKKRFEETKACPICAHEALNDEDLQFQTTHCLTEYKYILSN